MEKKNQLEVIVKESQLGPSESKTILEKFSNYFKIADECAAKAKAIKVTSADQKTDMETARILRLFLREKRIDVEKARKALKEQALRKGQVIDGIAKTLKGLLAPIETYLDEQEHFVEIQEEKKREAKRLEIEQRMQKEEEDKAKAEAEKQEQIRLENVRLKKEAEEREEKVAKERKKQEAKLAKEKAKAAKEKQELEDKAKKEREEAEAKRYAEAEKAETIRAAEAEKHRKATEKLRKEREVREKEVAKEKEKAKAKEDAERKEKERLAEILRNQIICPKCKHKFELEGGKK